MLVHQIIFRQCQMNILRTLLTSGLNKSESETLYAGSLQQKQHWQHHESQHITVRVRMWSYLQRHSGRKWAILINSSSCFDRWDTNWGVRDSWRDTCLWLAAGPAGCVHQILKEDYSSNVYCFINPSLGIFTFYNHWEVKCWGNKTTVTELYIKTNVKLYALFVL